MPSFRLFVIMSIVYLGGVSPVRANDAVPLPSGTPSSVLRPGVQVTFGYWNDNFISTDLFGGRLEDGGDDHVTASFWVQTGFENSGRWWLVDFYHNILTNRQAGYRTDLLTCRLSHERRLYGCLVQGGLGIIGEGNFGGQSIQNAYHRIAGIRRVNLDYESGSDLGIVFYARCKRPVVTAGSTTASIFAGVSHRSDVGPSNYRAGIDADTAPFTVGRGCSLTFQGRAGYIRYYNKSRRLSPIFDGGFTWGALVSLFRRDHCGASFWITGNQYGRHHPHFGVSIFLSRGCMRPASISDIMYP